MTDPFDTRTSRAAMYPLLLDLTGRNVLVVGGGPIAERRVAGLLECGARVRVVAPRITEGLSELAASSRIQWEPRTFEREDVASCALVFSATGVADVDSVVAAAARERGIFVNSADDVPGCDFYVPAVERRGDIVIAVGTGGGSPALAARLRDRFAAALGPEWERLAGLLAKVRRLARETLPDRAERTRVLTAAARDDALLAALARGEDPQPAEVLRRFGAHDAANNVGAVSIAEPTIGERAFVSLVGAGPGAPDLLTVRAYERVREADVIVYDDLVDREVLSQARADAELVYCGKRGWRDCPRRPGPALLVQRALEAGGKRVVRLKGGDPSVFGRSTEEIAALDAAGVPYEIVPAVTAALAAAAAARIPLTERGIAGSLTLATGVAVGGGAGTEGDPTPADIASLIRAGSTVAIYMGLRVLPEVTASLARAGVSADLPVAVVGSASLPGETVLTGTIGDIAEKVAEAAVPSPAIVVIGRVVARERRSTHSTCE